MTDTSPNERLAAHERLSTGALAAWARRCATHPWRVVGTWVGIILVLIALVATIGGSLRDKFEIPGSDTQRATDLIKAEFPSKQGSVLDIVFAAPPGQRLDTPARKAAIAAAVTKLRSAEFKPTAKEAGLVSVDNPLVPRTTSKDGRIAYSEAYFNKEITEAQRAQVSNVEDFARTAMAATGVTVEYNGEAEQPPIKQGTSES